MVSRWYTSMFPFGMARSTALQISTRDAMALLHLSWLIAQKPPVLSSGLLEALSGDASSLLERLRRLRTVQMSELTSTVKTLEERRIRLGPLRWDEMNFFLDSLSGRFGGPEPNQPPNWESASEWNVEGKDGAA